MRKRKIEDEKSSGRSASRVASIISEKDTAVNGSTSSKRRSRRSKAPSSWPEELRVDDKTFKKNDDAFKKSKWKNSLYMTYGKVTEMGSSGWHRVQGVSHAAHIDSECPDQSSLLLTFGCVHVPRQKTPCYIAAIFVNTTPQQRAMRMVLLKSPLPDQGRDAADFDILELQKIPSITPVPNKWASRQQAEMIFKAVTVPMTKKLAEEEDVSDQTEDNDDEKDTVVINADSCIICGDGGTLLLCSKCPHSYHLACLGISTPLESIPDDWKCGTSRKRCTTKSADDLNAAALNLYERREKAKLKQAQIKGQQEISAQRSRKTTGKRKHTTEGKKEGLEDYNGTDDNGNVDDKDTDEDTARTAEEKKQTSIDAMIAQAVQVAMSLKGQPPDKKVRISSPVAASQLSNQENTDAHPDIEKLVAKAVQKAMTSMLSNNVAIHNREEINDSTEGSVTGSNVQIVCIAQFFFERF